MVRSKWSFHPDIQKYSFGYQAHLESGLRLRRSCYGGCAGRTPTSKRLSGAPSTIKTSQSTRGPLRFWRWRSGPPRGKITQVTLRIKPEAVIEESGLEETSSAVKPQEVAIDSDVYARLSIVVISTGCKRGRQINPNHTMTPSTP